MRSIQVNEGNRKGNVEVWLDDIQKMMFETIKDITKRALLDTSTKRIDWVRKWVGQVVLSVNQIRWSKGCEDVISKKSTESYKDLK